MATAGGERANPLRVVRWAELDAGARGDFLSRGVDRIFDPSLRESICSLIDDVREHGDAALVRALERFDRCEVGAEELWVGEGEIEAALAAVGPAVRDAIRAGIENVRAFNRPLVAEPEEYRELRPGLLVAERQSPIASAGLFVPSGKGSFPSVLVQIGTPAVLAGVPEIVVAVPPRPGGDGAVDPAVLCVAHELGLTGVLRANGPAGVAALALGTETVPRVRKVLGPGSPPVQAAQVECQRHGCHTQMLLGPSESMVVADEGADPRLLAADLLNEAEHGDDSSVVLVTTSEELVERLGPELEAQLAELPEPRRGYARAALGGNGGAVLVADLDEAATVANLYAPEHLQVAVADPDPVVEAIDHAGEILVGQTTPFAVANYLVGAPAALPTGGFARVTGGVTARTFVKHTAVVKLAPEGLERLGPGALALAEQEGFPAHAAAIRARGIR